MTQQEVIVILGMLQVEFPHSFKSFTKENANQKVMLWSQMFAEDNPKLVTEAVKALLCEDRQFAPTVGEIKKQMRLITNPQKDTETEAWNQVKKAISYYSAKDNFESLSPLLQKLVGSPQQLREWSQMDIAQLETVVKSNFMRSYTARVKANEQYDSLPESTKQLISGFSEKFKMLGEVS